MQNAAHFLIQAVLSLALYVVLLRFWMQWVRADFRNQLGQFIIAMTNPIVIPLRKILPSIGTIDTATVVLALLIAAIKLTVYVALHGASANLVTILMISIGLVLRYSIYLFIGAILVGIIASWVNPHTYHPVVMVARSISAPLLAPAQRLIPPLAGLDFSPVVVLLLLQASLYLIWEYLAPIPI
ncbi:membrane protein [Arenicella chitinivorans]|uniref:Membrane protein n=1 Tax=Arenicella chitinivorans TaxID=1329800 RepID=A0A918RQ81_9GAMM|nr:YggT family protein [Arenicella chitinivorans]GHA05153.1 membrane protein [Arenicella chitinivorans]